MKKLLIAALLSVAPLVASAVEYETIYESTNTTTGDWYNGGTSYVGNYVTFAGSGYLESFTFEYTSTGSSATTADVRFYSSDGTLIYDSGSFSITSGTSQTITLDTSDFGSLYLSGSIYWVVSFSGGDVGLDLSYTSPDIGSSDSYIYTLNAAGTKLESQYLLVSGVDTASTFAAQFIVAVPEPATLALLGIGGLACFGMFRRKK